jgi:phosphonate transport system substrate-binding protein
MVISEPEVAERVRVIETWGPFGINPVVVNPLLDRELKDGLREAFLGIDQNPRGRRILRELMIERFVLPEDGIYDSVLAMRDYLRDRGLGP